MTTVDRLDALILLALDDDPDATTLALAARLGVARNTVATRLRRLRTDGVIRGFDRRVDPAALGSPLTAFVSIELSQTSGRRATSALAGVPEVVEMHSTTGASDLLLKVVARDPADLHRITGEFLRIHDVVRTSTVLSLQQEMQPRTRPLVERIAAPAGG